MPTTRLAGGDVLAESIEIGLRRQAAAGADQHDVGLANRVGHAGKAVLVLRIGVDDRHLKAERLEIRLHERGQRHLGLVLVVADQHRDVAMVAAEAERLAAEKLDAGDRRADELLDVLDDQVACR